MAPPPPPPPPVLNRPEMTGCAGTNHIENGCNERVEMTFMQSSYEGNENAGIMCGTIDMSPRLFHHDGMKQR